MAMTTGQRIRHYRDRAGMSQRALEEKTDLSQATITRIEIGDRPLKPYELSAIAAALCCPESSLMETHPLRERVQYAARTVPGKSPDLVPVTDHLRYLLEMDNYLTRALGTVQST